jgi:hypothetical protein
MRKDKKIHIPADLAQAILDHLDELGAGTIEEYVEAVLRSQLLQAGHISAYSQEEEEEVERRLRDLGYLD